MRDSSLFAVERATLTALMRLERDESLPECLDKSLFEDRRHRVLFEAIAAQSRNGREIDPILLVEECVRARVGRRDAVSEYVAELVADYGNPANLDEYVDRLATHRDQTKILRASELIVSELRTGVPIHEALRKFNEATRSLTEPRMTRLMDAIGERIEIQTASDYVAEEVPAQQWIIPGWIPESSLVMIYGRWGVGKSIFSLAIAEAVASGTRAMGCDIEPSPVLWLPLEDPPHVVRARLAALPSQPANLYIPSIRTTNNRRIAPAMSADDGIETLRALLEHTQARLAFLDPLRYFFRGDENDSTEVAAALHGLSRLSHRYGTTFCLVHHEGKRGGEDDATAFRGSSAWGAEVDVVIRVSNQGGPPESRGPKNLTISCGKMRADVQPPPLYCSIVDGPRIAWRSSTSVSAREAEIVDAIGDDELDAAEIADRLNVTKKTVQNRIGRLVDDGHVLRITKPNETRFRVAPTIPGNPTPLGDGNAGKSRGGAVNCLFGSGLEGSCVPGDGSGRVGSSAIRNTAGAGAPNDVLAPLNGETKP